MFVDDEEAVKRNLEHMFEDTGKDTLVRRTLILHSMLYIIKIVKENAVRCRKGKSSGIMVVRSSQRVRQS